MAVVTGGCSGIGQAGVERLSAEGARVVNLTRVYLCCRAVLPFMVDQGWGSIINTASFVAVMGAATSQISYSASKGGVLDAVLLLASEESSFITASTFLVDGGISGACVTPL